MPPVATGLCEIRVALDFEQLLSSRGFGRNADPSILINRSSVLPSGTHVLTVMTLFFDESLHKKFPSIFYCSKTCYFYDGEFPHPYVGDRRLDVRSNFYN